MTTKRLAIIGGSTAIGELEVINKLEVDTPFGSCSSALSTVKLDGKEAIYMYRHGDGHTIPPHKINYCANIWALHSVGVTHVIGLAAVGGIASASQPGKIIIPDQIIDYTYGRKHTFFESALNPVTHIDFVEPYCDELRKALIKAAANIDLMVLDSGTYGVTQGPRLETAAEVIRLKNDGCDLVGMTAMPEAALARELGLCYATCAHCVNWAAGLETSKHQIDLSEMHENIVQGQHSVRRLIIAMVRCL